MDVSWLVLLVSAAVFLSLILLAAVCMDCRNKGPLVSIRQVNASEEYMPSTEFVVIHSSHPTTDLSSIHSPSNLLSPYRNSPDPGSQRRQRSYTPTETESNPSYENPIGGTESIDSDPEDGYIIVLADDEVPQNRQSRASSPYSDAQHDYENCGKSDDSKSSVLPSDDEADADYQNVNPNQSKATAESSGVESSDDDEGNYVNQLPIIHS